MKYADKLERKIDKLVTENEAAKENLQARINKAEADKVEGQKELDAAAEVNDDAAYHMAKDKIRYAEDTIEMCNKRLESFNISLCSEQEHEKTVNEIHDETEKAEREAEKKAAPLVKELYKLAAELNQTIDENNKLLGKWCSLIHKDSMPPKYYGKSASEVLFLGNMINKRKTARKGLQDAGMVSLNIYDSIKD